MLTWVIGLLVVWDAATPPTSGPSSCDAGGITYHEVEQGTLYPDPAAGGTSYAVRDGRIVGLPYFNPDGEGAGHWFS